MDEKIFELMAAADDLQTHAAKLQVSAEEVLSAVPKAVEQAEKTVRLAVEQTGQDVEKRLRSVWLHGAAYVLAMGLVVSAASVAVISWQTSSLRKEASDLRAEVEDLKTQSQEFASKAGKAKLSDCGRSEKKTRLCIRVDEQAGRYGNSQAGELYMIIYGY